MYTEMSTTQPTASIPHKKKMKFITASSHSAGVRGIRTRFSREEDFYSYSDPSKKPRRLSLSGQADAAGYFVNGLALSVSALRVSTALPKGEPLAKPETLHGLPRPLTLKDFPRSGQILPAPGRNVTAGDKERSRCRVSDKKGNKAALRKQ